MRSTLLILFCKLLIFFATPQTGAEIEPISVQKCRYYSQYVYTNRTVVNLDTSVTIESINTCRQIDEHFEGRIPASPIEFPHSALLGVRQVDGHVLWENSGSLVSERYVLSSGHYLSSRFSEHVTHVRLGELLLNNNTDDASVVDIAIERIIVHPEFIRSSRYNDIGLVRLAHKVTLSPYIRPICLPTTNLESTRLIGSGWALLEFASTRSDALLKFNLHEYNNTECNEYFGQNRDRKLRRGIIETQICAGARNDSSGCGDTGSPLQIYHPDVYCMYTQIGVLSFGYACGFSNVPDVYTRVYSYVPWIESIVWAVGEDD